MSNDSLNRRGFTRVQTRIEAIVEAPGFVAIQGLVRDVSMKGVFLEAPHAPPVDCECNVHLILTGVEPPLVIHASGRIVRVDRDGFSLDFIEVELNSFEHLRRLVSYNAPDADEIDREFLGNNKSTRVH